LVQESQLSQCFYPSFQNRPKLKIFASETKSFISLQCPARRIAPRSNSTIVNNNERRKRAAPIEDVEEFSADYESDFDDEDHFTLLSKYKVYDVLDYITSGNVSAIIVRDCIFPNITFGELSSKLGITKLDNLTFQSFLHLNHTIRSDLFKDLKPLQKLSIPSNGLTNLPVHLLQPLENLKVLELRDNNLNIPDDFFLYAPKVESLELKKIGLSEIKPGFFGGLFELKHLNLWNNNLVKITYDMFLNVTNLESLDLQSNQIVEIAPNAFYALPNLKKINLFNNSLDNIHVDLFRNNTELEVLKLHGNRKPVILPDTFLSNFKNLKEVYLMKNGLTNVSEKLFDGTTSLKNLSLASNVLTDLPLTFLINQTCLRSLDLSNNKLKNISHEFLKNLKNLEILKLQSNLIFEIPG